MILLKSIEECTEEELDSFEALVSVGGKVDPKGLSERIRNNSVLIGLYLEGNELVSIAAIKKPNPNYHRRIFTESGNPGGFLLYPLEYGWANTKNGFKKRGLSSQVSKEILAKYLGVGVYATAQTDNKPIYRILQKNGFKKLGSAYPGLQGEIQLFVREPYLSQSNNNSG